MAYRVYRRLKGSDTWHFCRNCTLDPKSDYDSQTTRPTTGELCDQCIGKENQGTCTY